jgi:Eukaryotic-type carbonic anhydrase
MPASVANATGAPASVRDRKLLRRSVKDVITDNAMRTDGGTERILLDPENFRPADRSDEEWAEWIEAYSANERGTASERQRKLLEGDYLSFHNYQFLIDVRTEYYFRYSGTSTVPPCYGPYTAGSRGNTNHWRVLKDPIRVHPRQISEMERLLRERIAPKDGNSTACENETAGKVDSDGHISVARPLMQFHYTHFMTFCECQDWESKWPDDRAWCRLQKGDQLTRLYDHPYNFDFGDVFQK